jgi:hypothetical protein
VSVTTRGRWRGILAVAAVLLSAATAAGAEPVTKSQCVDADTRAQSLRREKKLGAAREQLRICSDPACPKMVRDDCAQRTNDLNAAEPTIVFVAKDGSGADLLAVHVTMGGHLFAEKLDGSALPVDPGEHDFTFDSAGQPSVTRHLVLHEGERGRRETIVIGKAPPSTPPPVAESHPGRGQRVAGVVVGALGVVGVGVGAVFGAMASSDFSHQKSDCPAAGCPNHAQAVTDHDGATSAANGSTIGFISGGVLVAGGIALFVTAPKGTLTTGSALQLAPTVGAGGAGMLLRGTF